MKKFLVLIGVLTLPIYMNFYGFQHETHPEGKKEMTKICYCPSKESKYRSMTSEIKAKEGEMKTLYTCPMHKEVIMEKEGKCSCGMKLEPKKMIYKKGKWENYEEVEKTP